MSYHPADFPVFWTACALFAFGVIIQSIIFLRFIRGLDQHPRMKAYFGTITMWSHPNLISVYPIVDKLYRRDYFSVNDLNGRNFCNAYRVPVISSYVFAILAIIVSMILLVFQGPVYLGELIPI